MDLYESLDFMAKYEMTSTTALSTNPTVAVPLLTINGWIMMQRKIMESSISFNQNWAAYRDGFGSATGVDNYWLGLEKVYRLVQLGSAKLRIEVDKNVSDYSSSLVNDNSVVHLTKSLHKQGWCDKPALSCASLPYRHCFSGNTIENHSIDVVQKCRSYFGIKLPSCLIKKRQDKFLSRHGLTVWTMYLVDIVVSYDFFVLLCSELISFSLFLLPCILSTTDVGEQS